MSKLLTQTLDQVDLVDVIRLFTRSDGANRLVNNNNVCICDPRLGRDDKNPNFSIFYREGRGLWKAHNTGEDGNAYDFLKSIGLTKGEAAKELIRMANLDTAHPRAVSAASKPSALVNTNLPRYFGGPQVPGASPAPLSELEKSKILAKATEGPLPAPQRLQCLQPRQRNCLRDTRARWRALRHQATRLKPGQWSRQVPLSD